CLTGVMLRESQTNEEGNYVAAKVNHGKEPIKTGQKERITCGVSCHCVEFQRGRNHQHCQCKRTQQAPVPDHPAHHAEASASSIPLAAEHRIVERMTQEIEQEVEESLG